MNFLLDTHTFIWYLESSQELSPLCRTAIEDASTNNFVSIAPFWELAIKLSIGGKLELSVSLDQLATFTRQNNIRLLPIQVAHTIVVRSLPFHNKDPFDRLIIAQAIVEGMTVLSRDSHFNSYAVRIAW